MPAKVRNIEAERETRLQQVVGSIYVVFFAVYMNRSHSQHASKWPTHKAGVNQKFWPCFGARSPRPGNARLPALL
ncbi:hypothetical protein L580_2948 [Serratia fonticola AU-P3(3)]|nr:hypothetical protein L580_2948 [Serratia fonticola AU-P3(3)]